MARKTKAEALATRNALLDAAEALFQQRGVSRTSLQDIAQAAGVTRGAVYWHFRDKADLFNAMMGRVLLPIEEPPAATGPTPEDGAIERLRKLLLETLERVVHDEHVFRVFEIALHKVEYVDALASVRERHLEAIRDYLDVIERCLARAGLPEGQCAMHARGLHALVAGLIQTWMLGPSTFDLVATGRHAIDTHLAAVCRLAGISAPDVRTAARGRAPVSAGKPARRTGLRQL